MLAYAFPTLRFLSLICAAIAIGVVASILIVVTAFSLTSRGLRAGRLLTADCVAVTAFVAVCLLLHHLYPEYHWKLGLSDWLAFCVPALLTLAFMLMNRRSG